MLKECNILFSLCAFARNYFAKDAENAHSPKFWERTHSSQYISACQCFVLPRMGDLFSSGSERLLSYPSIFSISFAPFAPLRELFSFAKPLPVCYFLRVSDLTPMEMKPNYPKLEALERNLAQWDKIFCLIWMDCCMRIIWPIGIISTWIPLLSLQNPKTSFPDEEIFIMYHQITELYFKLSLHEYNQLAGNSARGQLFLSRVNRINSYFENLVRSFDIMVHRNGTGAVSEIRMSLLRQVVFKCSIPYDRNLFYGFYSSLIKIPEQNLKAGMHLFHRCLKKFIGKQVQQNLQPEKDTNSSTIRRKIFKRLNWACKEIQFLQFVAAL